MNDSDFPMWFLKVFVSYRDIELVSLGWKQSLKAQQRRSQDASSSLDEESPFENTGLCLKLLRGEDTLVKEAAPVAWLQLQPHALFGLQLLIEVLHFKKQAPTRRNSIASSETNAGIVASH